MTSYCNFKKSRMRYNRFGLASFPPSLLSNMLKASVLITTAKGWRAGHPLFLPVKWRGLGCAWDCVVLILEKESTICQVSLSSHVKLVLVNYQVQLDSGINPPLMFTIILINAVIPNAVKTREKCCTGDWTPVYLHNKQSKFFSTSRLRVSLERLQLEDCPH